MPKNRIHKLLIFGGSSTPSLVDEICELIGTYKGEIELSRFANGEVYVRFMQSVRGSDVFVVQTLGERINDDLMELLIMVDALKRASAYRITAVIPHYGYSRQDKKSAAREPITAKLVADLLSVAGIERLITMDLHAGQIQGFFNAPVDHLTAVPILAEYIKTLKLKSLVVVSPDVGRVKTVKKFADYINAPIAVLHKRRPKRNVAEVMHIVGEVKNKNIVIIDDMIDTAGTMTTAINVLQDAGAKDVYACATHPIFSGEAVDRLNKSPVKEVIVTNTLPISDKKKFPKLKTLSIGPLFAKTIENVYKETSVSVLFKGTDHA